MSGTRVAGGVAIDRSHRLDFRWAGKQYRGFAGDTLASALLADGVRLFGRSFKYHRPRGLIAAGLDEPNAIVQIERGAATIPNLKAPYIELYDQLDAQPVNAWPSLGFDLMAVNGLFKRFIPAAFYYKTFMWPNWLLFEPLIRKAAGLGRAPQERDPDLYSQTSAHCDVLVVGGGIAGLAAALAAGRRGERVILATGGALWGGRLAGSDQLVEGQPATDWIAHTLAELDTLPNVLRRNRMLATGHYDQGLVALCERMTDHLPIDARIGPRQRLWHVRAGQVILATGAFERPLVFANNDLPGVMLAGAATAYLHRYGVLVGQNIVVATNNDSGWHAAMSLAQGGARIAAIVDARPSPATSLLAAAEALDITVRCGTAPEKAVGGKQVRAVDVARLDAASRLTGRTERLVCDTLLMSGGWNPAVHLHSQAGGALRLDPAQHSFMPAALPGSPSIGAAAGDFAIKTSLAAARGTEFVPVSTPIRPLWSLARTAEPDPLAWVDFQNDVTAADVALAARENFRSVEHLKRYTTLGMASDQGKTSNVNGIGILSQFLGRPMEAIGTTRFRPPYDPTTIGVFAGHRIGDGLAPRRRLALDAWHVAAGAKLEEYGGWMRPVAYLQEGETEAQAVAREVIAVRTRVGLFEASPLGKIEVKGPDAARFLDRIYVNTISTLKDGRCRYGVMLDENGTIFDDGVVTRLADDHFLVGTTSGHASAIAEILEEWLQCEWVDLRVLVQDVTTCWAVLTVAGPKARDVLQTLEGTIDWSASAFPHMQHRAGLIAGMNARVARVSFSGELSYEVSVPWRQADRLGERLTAAGAVHGLTPFGIEALMTMRIEKGFLHVGSETDGTTQPQDVGFAAVLANKKSDFVGRRSTRRPDSLRGDRRQLVGVAVDGPLPVEPGAHVVTPGREDAIGSEGWITSSAWSPTIGAPVALAMVNGGAARMGETVKIWDLGTWRKGRIVPPCRYDPDGSRLNG
ncbi:sarcosine oxidase subunit alpha family protein [Sphingomonas sp. MG17]|uniref:Sarcosine oxidase subunit alpha family protein n=1 Tax=Sphingomonas tagetis TaxID=2949092 RepID=A0A9X2HSL1_9SPHN|nr:sarcosine oxidase subunit alpha family protein [Sphingomonas tagetis]MCP3732723.1 sarcosine oxidase subunit alpha family protein [Sphingomonas tagetis]